MDDDIYNKMFESEGHYATITIDDGTKIHGFVNGFETRFDNEDDDNEWAGTGSICSYADDGTGMLMYEAHIKDIEIDD